MLIIASGLVSNLASCHLSITWLIQKDCFFSATDMPLLWLSYSLSSSGQISIHLPHPSSNTVLPFPKLVTPPLCIMGVCKLLEESTFHSVLRVTVYCNCLHIFHTADYVSVLLVFSVHSTLSILSKVSKEWMCPNYMSVLHHEPSRFCYEAC